jgi:hypothetical protein
MEKNKVDFTRLRRLAPGRFSEEMLSLLSAGVDFAQYRIDISRIELGESPFTEQLNVTFIVTLPDDRKRLRLKGQRSGPKLSFTFSASASPEKNLEEFREFVRQNAAAATLSPEAEPIPRAAHSAGPHGD